ncbi:hypothetical protein HK102_013835 [Quaeritorhiza haematococci]|nr:hypothetical protein HK102_013835 [Quaeritorhiza haematococci]
MASKVVNTSITEDEIDSVAKLLTLREQQEAKLALQSKLNVFVMDENNLQKSNLLEARKLYEAQLLEIRQLQLRQAEEASALISEEQEKFKVVKLLDRITATRMSLSDQVKAREKVTAFRLKSKHKRRAFATLKKEIEARQLRQRKELQEKQLRVAENMKKIQEIEVLRLNEEERVNKLKEYTMLAQQLKNFELEIQKMEELETLISEQKLQEQKLEAKHKLELQYEEEQLIKQEAKAKAAKLIEKQKQHLNRVKQAQRRAAKQLEKQQKKAAKRREKEMLMEAIAMFEETSEAAQMGKADRRKDESENEGVDGKSEGSLSWTDSADMSDDGTSTGTSESSLVDDDCYSSSEEALPAENAEPNAISAEAEKDVEDEDDARVRTKRNLEELIARQKAAMHSLKAEHKEQRVNLVKMHKHQSAALQKEKEEEFKYLKAEQAEAMDELRKQQESATKMYKDAAISKNILLQMLPPYVLNEIQAGREPTPQTFQNVTVLFGSINEFKTLSQNLPPERVVELLNDVTRVLDDEVLERSQCKDVYKVESVLDSYMCCSRLSVEKQHFGTAVMKENAAMMADCALAMMDGLQDVLKARGIEYQIGIHVGNLMGGIVGIKGSRFCLFGDTVNTASRMNSTGLPGKIHVSESVYELLSDRYEFEERGKIEVKGKGVMNTYWLLGPKPSHVGNLIL